MSLPVSLVETELNGNATRCKAPLRQQAAEALFFSAPATRDGQRKQNSSKQEFAMAVAEPMITTTVEEDPTAPPTIITTSKNTAVDHLRLHASLSLTNQNTSERQLQQRCAAPADAVTEPRRRMAATQARRVVDTAREEYEEKGSVEDDAAHGLPAEEGIAENFQCPAVPRMVIALLVCTAVVQSFSSSAIVLFINMELHLGPVEVTRYWMYIGYTAWIQPAIGYMSDALALFGEKRRPLFILAAVGNAVVFLCYYAVPWVTCNYGVFVVMSLVSQFFTMGLYIPLNGLAVEVGRHDAESEEESMARMSAIMSKTMVWRSIGSLIGNILQTCLVVSLSVPTLLGFTSFLFVILVPTVLVAPRKLFLRSGTQDQNFYKRVAEAGRLVWRSFDIHDIRSDGFCFIIVLAFVFVYTMMPDAGSVFYNYLFGAYSFPTWFYSLNNCIGYVGSIAGAYAFSLWMDHQARQETHGGKRTSLFFIFTIGSFAWAFGYITNLLLCTGFITKTVGIPAAVYVPVDNFFMSMFVRFAFMPTLTMAAEHAPKFFEATTFEVFSVASIGGGTISALLTSEIAEHLGITRINYSKLWILITISIALKLVPIPLAYLLPERYSRADELPTGDGDNTGGSQSGEAEGEGLGDAASKNTTDEPAVTEAMARHMKNASARMLQGSDDEYDPFVPLTQNYQNLV